MARTYLAKLKSQIGVPHSHDGCERMIDGHSHARRTTTVSVRLGLFCEVQFRH